MKTLWGRCYMLATKLWRMSGVPRDWNWMMVKTMVMAMMIKMMLMMRIISDLAWRNMEVLTSRPGSLLIWGPFQTERVMSDINIGLWLTKSFGGDKYMSLMLINMDNRWQSHWIIDDDEYIIDYDDDCEKLKPCGTKRGSRCGKGVPGRYCLLIICHILDYLMRAAVFETNSNKQEYHTTWIYPGLLIINVTSAHLSSLTQPLYPSTSVISKVAVIITSMTILITKMGKSSLKQSPRAG